MHRTLRLALCLAATCAAITGCKPPAQTRYYLTTEKLPNGTVTSVIDSKSNTQLLYIAELSLDPPSINVLPISWLDIDSVRVGPIDEVDVLVSTNENERGAYHSVIVAEPDLHAASTLVNLDSNVDGRTDRRSLRFQTDVGFMEYFDLDADGTLDAMSRLTLGETPATDVKILVDQCWIPVTGDQAVLYDPPHTATTRETPVMEYRFRGGTWQESTNPTSD